MSKTDQKKAGGDKKDSKTDTSKADSKGKPDLGLLEEDDEFEEFATEDYDGEEESTEGGSVNVWEDNWDDDNIEEDFSTQLQSEIQKQGQKYLQPEPMKTQ